MRSLARLVARTFVRGIFFVAPIALLIILFVQTMRIAANALDPITKLISTDTADKLVADLIAVAMILGLCFLAGAFAGTAFGSGLSDRLEHIILRQIPGFSLVKSMTHGFIGMDTGDEVKTALAWIEESWVPAFVMERHKSGLSTVFVPSAPTPAAGTIYYLPDERVRLLDVPVSAAVACVTRLGVGSHLLLADIQSGERGAILTDP